MYRFGIYYTALPNRLQNLTSKIISNPNFYYYICNVNIYNYEQ